MLGSAAKPLAFQGKRFFGSHPRALVEQLMLMRAGPPCSASEGMGSLHVTLLHVTLSHGSASGALDWTIFATETLYAILKAMDQLVIYRGRIIF
jgi:hypothetical protein